MSSSSTMSRRWPATRVSIARLPESRLGVRAQEPERTLCRSARAGSETAPSGATTVTGIVGQQSVSGMAGAMEGQIERSPADVLRLVVAIAVALGAAGRGVAVRWGARRIRVRSAAGTGCPAVMDDRRRRRRDTDPRGGRHHRRARLGAVGTTVAAARHRRGGGGLGRVARRSSDSRSSNVTRDAPSSTSAPTSGRSATTASRPCGESARWPRASRRRRRG